MGGVGGHSVHRHVLDTVEVLELMRDLVGGEGAWKAKSEGMDVSLGINEVDRTK